MFELFCYTLGPISDVLTDVRIQISKYFLMLNFGSQSVKWGLKLYESLVSSILSSNLWLPWGHGPWYLEVVCMQKVNASETACRIMFVLVTTVDVTVTKQTRLRWPFFRSVLERLIHEHSHKAMIIEINPRKIVVLNCCL